VKIKIPGKEICLRKVKEISQEKKGGIIMSTPTQCDL